MSHVWLFMGTYLVGLHVWADDGFGNLAAGDHLSFAYHLTGPTAGDA